MNFVLTGFILIEFPHCRMMDQIEAFSHDRKRWRILYDDENFVEYVRDKEVKVQIKHWFNVLEK